MVSLEEMTSWEPDLRKVEPSEEKAHCVGFREGIIRKGTDSRS